MLFLFFSAPLLKEEIDFFYRPSINDWLKSRCIRARALLSSGRLDEAREECDYGILESKNSNERVNSISLGIMRAQIHTSEGEDQDAITVLDRTETLNAVKADVNLENDSSPKTNTSSSAAELDSFVLDPIGCCEGKSSEESVHRVYGKHCRLTFLFLLPLSNLFHCL